MMFGMFICVVVVIVSYVFLMEEACVYQDNAKREWLLKQCISKLTDANKTIATMESCTSGLIASMLTNVEGSSKVFKGGFVTYSNEAKIKNGVPKDVIEKYGVYSLETATAMAKACKEFYGTDYGIGVTGTTGNIDPNNKDSKIGNVYIAIATPKETMIYLHQIDTNNMTRKKCKEKIVDFVFNKLHEITTEKEEILM